jgi:serine beta-lactamase-like protein LACTB, mitochondrial
MSLRPTEHALRVLLWAAFCIPALSQSSPAVTQTIDSLLSSYIASHHIPALSLSVVDHGEVILVKGFGQADVESGVPASGDTVYRIASLSKPITATAAMMLVESGRLDLDAPIQKYCPAFPQKPWPITARELLSHQSGIRDYRNIQETLNTRHYDNLSDALSQFASDPLEFEPGTRMQYTSYGYLLLGCVIEGASGMAFNDYMQKAVFLPARMSATRLDDVFAIIPHRARGYVLSAGGTLQNAPFVDVSNKPPGSGINSTARDMGNFLAALFAGELVSAATLERMLTPQKTRDGKSTIYGLGFFRGGPLSSYRGLEEAGHGGDQQGFSSTMYLLPSRQFGVVILCNLEAENSSQDFIALSRAIFDAIAAPQ